MSRTRRRHTGRGWDAVNTHDRFASKLLAEKTCRPGCWVCGKATRRSDHKSDRRGGRAVIRAELDNG